MASSQILTKKHFRKLVQDANSTPEYQSGHFTVSLHAWTLKHLKLSLMNSEKGYIVIL